ncbi:MAG: FAD:protein FMN transferase [Deltaproteobacteria bacterium]|nr:FAD:protein FMN transferase [Deltaproteobacteria bacterium]MBW2658069.1 FAD:protein FMN transferase [Deltaproteobacteria bacterium]
MENSSTQCDQNRRSFLKLSGLLGLGAAAAALLPAEGAEAFLFNSNEYKVVKTGLAMGTFVTMTAIHSSKDEAEEAIGLAFNEINRLSSLLTHFDASSPVGILNGQGKLEQPPRELMELMVRSLYYYRQTGGAFDITVKPVMDLYQSSFAAGHRPDEKEIAAVLDCIGMEHVRFQKQTIEFAGNNMAVTLDGIAKGYIVDRASDVLTAHGLSSHMINAGGDIRASGSAAGGRAWTVAVQDPKKTKQYPDIITLQGGAVATSGNYEVYFDNEKIFHHIIDSHTGLSPQLSTSVTIIAPTVMDADALSTSVFVLEPEAGVQFINSHHDCECFIIAKDGAITRSNGWKV